MNILYVARYVFLVCFHKAERFQGIQNTLDTLLSSCLHPDTETKQGEYNSKFGVDFKPEFMLYSVCAFCFGIWK